MFQKYRKRETENATYYFKNYVIGELSPSACHCITFYGFVLSYACTYSISGHHSEVVASSSSRDIPTAAQGLGKTSKTLVTDVALEPIRIPLYSSFSSLKSCNIFRLKRSFLSQGKKNKISHYRRFRFTVLCGEKNNNIFFFFY